MLWRTVTNFLSRCYLTGDSKYTEPAEGRMLQKKRAGTCVGWKGGISAEPGPIPWGFALFYWVKKRKNKEQREKKKKAVSPEKCCVYGLIHIF